MKQEFEAVEYYRLNMGGIVTWSLELQTNGYKWRIVNMRDGYNWADSSPTTLESVARNKFEELRNQFFAVINVSVK